MAPIDKTNVNRLELSKFGQTEETTSTNNKTFNFNLGGNPDKVGDSYEFGNTNVETSSSEDKKEMSNLISRKSQLRDYLKNNNIIINLSDEDINSIAASEASLEQGKLLLEKLAEAKKAEQKPTIASKDIGKLSQLPKEQFEKAICLINVPCRTKHNQFNYNDINEIIKLNNEDFKKVQDFILNDENLKGITAGKIVLLATELNDDQLKKVLPYVQSRTNNGFHGDIYMDCKKLINIAKIEDESQFQRAVKFCLVGSRGTTRQFSADEVKELSMLTGDAHDRAIYLMEVIHLSASTIIKLAQLDDTQYQRALELVKNMDKNGKSNFSSSEIEREFDHKKYCAEKPVVIKQDEDITCFAMLDDEKFAKAKLLLAMRGYNHDRNDSGPTRDFKTDTILKLVELEPAKFDQMYKELLVVGNYATRTAVIINKYTENS